MPYEIMRYARVTLRHAIERDQRAQQKGSTGGAATASKRKRKPPVQLTLRTVETTVIASQTAGMAGPIPQTLRNRKSALHRATELLGLRDTDAANLLLGPALETTLTVIRGKGLPRKAASDLISHVKWWDKQSSHRFPANPVAGGPDAKRDTHIDRRFKNFLREKIKQAGLTYEQAAERSDIPLPTVYGWLKGVRPDRTAHPVLERLARVIQVSLADLLQFARRRPNLDVRGPQETRYSAYLNKCRKLQYILQCGGVDKDGEYHYGEVAPALREDWTRFLTHQVGRGTLVRSTHTGWRQSDWPESARGKPAWFEVYAGKHLPSANAFWRRVQQFLGWLRLPLEQGGFGLQISDVQTLAWLAQPQAVREFVAWCADRAGGVTNTGARNFRQCVHALCAPKCGWLRQQPEMRDRLPPEYRGLSWEELCDECLRFCDEHADKGVDRTRNPLRSIEKLRKLDDPCEPLFEAVQELLMEADSFADDTLARAIAYRDAALLSFLLILPVRLNTLKQLTVGTERNEVWFDGDEMHVMISRSKLKNGNWMGELEVDGVKSELTEAIRQYLEVGRPRLIGSTQTELLFVGTHDPHLMWNGASIRVRGLTQRFLRDWVPEGLPMQSFRHLVATRFLKLNPNNYPGVAALLHDRLDTVLSTYAPKDPTNAIKTNAHRFARRGPG